MSIWDNEIARTGLAAVAAKVAAGERLTFDDGLALYATPAIHVVGHLANQVRERLHGDRCWWVRNQHINYTNICNKSCLFCSFYAAPRDAERGYVLSPEQVADKVRAYLDIPIREVHVVGGVNPKLPYGYYLDLVRAIKAVRPEATLKAFTMIEIEQIARVGRKSVEECLRELRDAGLDMLPGGGAEVFSERVHEELFWAKGDSQRWVDVARTAHRLGLRSNATLLYGHVEQPAEKVRHLLLLRELQDETGGLCSFIPLSFHPEQTRLDHLPAPTGLQDLREIAVARLLLDNVPHIKSFWIMNTIGVTQAALWYGADDTDGTIQEYEITRDPHTDRRQVLTSDQLLTLIREAGRVPVERDGLYQAKTVSGTVSCPCGPETVPDTVFAKVLAGERLTREDGLRLLAHPNLHELGALADLEAKTVSGTVSCPCGPETVPDTAFAKVLAGERLTREDGLRLLAHPNLHELGALADLVRRRLHPAPVVTYVIGRNVNYTNVCWVQCSFCAFYRRPNDRSGEAYTLPAEAIFAKVEELLAVGDGGPVELLLQGGLNPKLRLDWYERLFGELRARYPQVWLHALSVTEVLYIAKLSKLSVRETLARLQAAGLGSLPGAGAELLDDDVRREIAPHKESTEAWLDVMRTAHELGLRSSATMMYGTLDTPAQRLNHLLRIRELQDETGGFTAFIPWNFQPDGTPLGERLAGRKTSGFDYLRTLAVARLMLDNVPNFQASWVTQGPKIAQLSLAFGVNDFGSTMLEENVVSAAGTSHTGEVTLAEMTRLIRDAGYEPRRRTTLYEPVAQPSRM